MSPQTATALTPSADLVARVEVLEQQVAQLLARLDDGADIVAKLLPVVAATFGSDGFLLREAFQSEVPALRYALTGLASRTVGELFSKYRDREIGGYIVTKIGVEHSAAIWSVGRVVRD